MIFGIVGSEGAKFTPETELKAREVIREQFRYCTKVVSGRCHLGGIDIWTIEEAKVIGKDYQEFPPATRNWDGFRDRNILIAKNSDVVVCITVKTLPLNYKVKGWEKFCYHCNTGDHIKSGGCWTVKYAKKIGKETKIIVIE